MSFIDEINLRVQSGKGGSGSGSFASSRRKARGGPSGGNGGQGGSIILQVQDHLTSLYHLNPNKFYKAESGQQGESNKKEGRKGKDLIIPVPLYTYMIEDHKEAYLKPNSEYTLLEGGRGGKGNTHFKTSINQAPTKVGRGEEAQTTSIRLEIRYPPDIAIVSLEYIDAFPLVQALSQIEKKDKKPSLTSKNRLNFPLLRYTFSKKVFVELPQIQDSSIKYLKHILSSQIIIQTMSSKKADTWKKEQNKLKQILNKYNPEFSNKKFISLLMEDGGLVSDLDKEKNCFSKINLLMESIKEYV